MGIVIPFRKAKQKQILTNDQIDAKILEAENLMIMIAEVLYRESVNEVGYQETDRQVSVLVAQHLNIFKELTSNEKYWRAYISKLI